MTEIPPYQGEYAWDYEKPEDCASTIGVAPFRQRLGAAITTVGNDAGVVIWTEQGEMDKWGPPTIIPVRYIHLAVSEAVWAATADPDALHLALRRKDV